MKALGVWPASLYRGWVRPRVPLPDGSYELKLPQGLETPSLKEENGMFWTYEGQQRFTDALDHIGVCQFSEG